MAERYRYRGRFVTESKARQLSNLRGASKHVTTERTDAKRHITRLSKGYKESWAKQIDKALKAERRRIVKEAIERGKRAIAERKIKEEKQKEERRAEKWAQKIRQRAEREDISATDAADYYADELEGFRYFSPEDIIGQAETFLEEDFLEFDVNDLESEEYEET